MAWTDLQIALLVSLDAYESAERASAICGDRIEGQWRKADLLHDELLNVALLCDFEPGGRHRHLSTVEFATQRAAIISRTLHNYVQEAGLHTLNKRKDA